MKRETSNPTWGQRHDKIVKDYEESLKKGEKEFLIISRD